MRTDKRLPDQMRPVEIVTGYLVTAEGDRVDIEPLLVSEIHAIIGAAYEGEDA